MKKITKSEQAKAERDKLVQESLERQLARRAYLKTLGLDKEVIISLSTLKEVFTDKNIKLHFAVPYDTAFNPNLSKSYQRDNPEAMMKLYLLARVLEKIKAGVKPRIKETLKDEHRLFLQRFIVEQKVAELEAELPTNPNKRKVIRKI